MRERLRHILIPFIAGLLVLPAPTAVAAFSAFDDGASNTVASGNGIPYCLIVTNAFAHPVPGAVVTMKGTGPLLGLTAAPAVVTTDAEGLARAIVPPAEYQISIMDPFGWYVPDAFAVKLLPGEDRCEAPATRALTEATALGYVTGRIVDGSFTGADGEPVPLPGVRLEFARDVGGTEFHLTSAREAYEHAADAAGTPGWEDDVRYRFRATTEGDGRFVLACPPAPGVAGVELRVDPITPHEPLRVAASVLADACGGSGLGTLGHVALVRSPVSVTGSVFVDGAPVAAATVHATFASEADDTALTSTSAPFVLNAVTSADGAFELALPWRGASEPGAWTLTATREGFSDDSSVTLDVPASAPLTHDFHLAPPPGVSVRPVVRSYTPLHEFGDDALGQRYAEGVTVCLNNTATPDAAPTCWRTDANGAPPTCVAVFEGEYEVALTGADWIGATFPLDLNATDTEACTGQDPFAQVETALLFPADSGAVRGRVEDAVARARLDVGQSIDDSGIPFFTVTSAGGDTCRTLRDGSFDCLLQLGGGSSITFTPNATAPRYIQQSVAGALVAGEVTEVQPVLLARTPQALTVNLTTTFPNGTAAAPPTSSHADVRTWHPEFGETTCTKGVAGEGFVNYACSAGPTTRWDANPTFTLDGVTVARSWGAPGFQVNASQPKGGVVYAPQSCENVAALPTDTVLDCAITADAGTRILTGLVLDAHDGSPVAGATVEAWNPVTRAVLDRDVCAAEAYACTNLTGADGAFTLNVPAFPDVPAFCFKITSPAAYQHFTPDDETACDDQGSNVSLFRAAVPVDVTVRDAHSNAAIRGIPVAVNTTGPALCGDSAAYACDATTSSGGRATLKLPWGMTFTVRTDAFEGSVQYTAGITMDADGDARLQFQGNALTRVTDASTWLPGEELIGVTLDPDAPRSVDLLLAREAVSVTGTTVLDGPGHDPDAATSVVAFPRWFPDGMTPAEFCAPAGTSSPDAPEFDACTGNVLVEDDGTFHIIVPVSHVRASVNVNAPDKPWTLTATRGGYYPASSSPTAGGDVGAITLRNVRGPDGTLRFLVRDVTDAPLEGEIVWVCIRHVEGPLDRADRSAELAHLSATADLATGPDASDRADAGAERCQYGHNVTFPVAWTRMTEANGERAENAFTFIVDATGHVPVTGIVEVTANTDEETVEVVRMLPTEPGLFACVGDGPEVCPASEGDPGLVPVEASARWLDRDDAIAGPVPGVWVVQPPQLTSRATVEAGASRVDLAAYAGEAVDGTWTLTFTPASAAPAGASDAFRVTVTFVGADGPFECVLDGAVLGAGHAYPMTWSFTVGQDGSCETVAGTVTSENSVVAAPDAVPRARFFADAAAFGGV